MKLSITPVAVAVALALGAVGAHAATSPAFGSTSPADGIANDGLYLAVWDNNTGFTDLVDLTSLYKDVSLTKSTLLVTPTPGSNGWTTASNVDGFASVDQLNLGTISNFSSVFPASGITSATNYMVLAGNTSGQQALVSGGLNNINPAAVSAIVKYDQSIVAESANWTSNSTGSPLVDLTGKANYSAIAGVGPLDAGSLSLSGANFAVNVGTAAGFYSYVANQLAGTASVTPYTFNGQEGFWLLSDTGNLSWNLVAASTVPLPPAVWLFASGLIGLGLIGRRKGLGAAV
jgi:hypothetical protein